MAFIVAGGILVVGRRFPQCFDTEIARFYRLLSFLSPIVQRQIGIRLCRNLCNACHKPVGGVLQLPDNGLLIPINPPSQRADRPIADLVESANKASISSCITGSRPNARSARRIGKSTFVSGVYRSPRLARASAKRTLNQFVSSTVWSNQ